ncbi:uncharacterized protein LOC128278629 [Anopheles cruzii]|uniref:uncharacterized protein LOC128278629 n=1 Tax=Anopheles cruzii TaxID=68878 RepID=UPI0022EC189F|nr:uncharacterized protein LOC128278629 [Anopheles cruzii]
MAKDEKEGASIGSAASAAGAIPLGTPLTARQEVVNVDLGNPFRLRCGDDWCEIANWDPHNDGTFMMQYMPQSVKVVIFKQILTSVLDTVVLQKAGNSPKECNIPVTALNLNINKLQTVNLELFKPFKQLIDFALSFNRIQLLVGRFESITLKYLFLENNQMVHLNLCQWNLPSLMWLFVSRNSLSEQPRCLADNLPMLTKLELSGNHYTHFDIA